MNTLIPWISSSVIAASITAIATIFAAGLGIYFARRIPSVDRNHSKRLAVIEIAKKRLEVRDHALSIELAATGSDSAEQEQAKLRARQAVQKVISDADSWMEYLEWDSQITRVVTKRPHNLTARKLSGMTRFFYGFLVLCSWIFRILFVVVILGIPVLWILDPNKNSPVTLLTMVIMEVLAILLMWFWLTFSREAQKIKFPKPDAPILDQL